MEKQGRPCYTKKKRKETKEMEFIRHRWKMILLMALLTAAILGGAMLFWSSTREKTYTGGLFVKEERQKEVAEAGM